MSEGATVVCWGELLWDLFPEGPRLGGAAANVAHHLARLGERPVLVSRVGADELGRRALELLDASGVDVEEVQIDPSAPTGTARVTLEGGEPRFSLATAAAWDRLELTDRVRALLAGPAGALVFGTLAQRSVLGSRALREAASAAAARHRVLDLNLRPPHDSFEVARAAVALATAVKLNEHELARVGAGMGAPDPLAWLLGRAALRHVAVTRGPRGSLLAARAAEGGWARLEHPGAPLSPIAGEDADTVGAGDAWTAVLVHSLLRGAALDGVPARADAYAAAVASRRGATPALDQALVDRVRCA